MFVKEDGAFDSPKNYLERNRLKQRAQGMLVLANKNPLSKWRTKQNKNKSRGHFSPMKPKEPQAFVKWQIPPPYWTKKGHPN